MTDRELMQQALEALERLEGWLTHEEVALQAALRERLAQPDAVINGMPAYEGPLSKAERLVRSEQLRTHWEGCEEVHPECREKNA